MTWLSRLDRAAGGLALDAGLYAVSAAFALLTAITSTLLPHRAWGAVAFWGYLIALIVVSLGLLLRRPAARAAQTWAVWALVTALPLVIQAVQRAAGHAGRAQEEVLVVEQMGERLAGTGTPYLGADAIRALPPGERLLAYHPYQPGMAVFGLPRAWFGDLWWTDARIWFAVVTVAAVGGAAALLGRNVAAPRPVADPVRGVQVVTVLPICALTLATGGDDLPVVALCVLALALSARGWFAACGVAVGAAAALKLFALPMVVVLAVHAVVTGQGRRYLPWALGLPVAVLIPALLVDADAVLENVIRFPLGHGVVTSPAQSPFPGYLIATGLPGGRYVAAGLLVAAGAVVAAMLVRRPPRTAASAARYAGLGLLAAILLMPTTRFGYLLYPAVLLVWAGALTPRVTDTITPRDDPAVYRL
ncbi:glycosyltransferase 87 family protein [Mangrovihabitans endophyticus]|uniref:DUF2029 domain-containing protein n=1 Tax=Mangrovihabitans endophyticus TaxID=1751298 RepID=A0A8J3C0L9_9ACTN|nr:glycosyltransferase 87 family protein [Mangrovihabitans endophyticus]GGK93580.1 hypothetical protein GCM10012284_29380 [Mangrovihabitans endophyticus]